jgi:hypothetical protein
MSVPPESIEVGACYLSNDGRVRKVMRFLTDGRVRYRYRGPFGGRWRHGALDLQSFVATVERSVPCNWTPEDEQS